MSVLLILLLYSSYYAFSGVIVKNPAVRTVMILGSASLWYAMYTVALGFSGMWETAVKALLLLSLLFNVLRQCGVRVPAGPLFSVFKVEQEHFSLNYLVFKPGFLILTNIFCMLKRLPSIRLSDVIEIDVRISERQIFLLKL